jgi:tRNA threonylcarbamoyladenosine biosynthesis protein TsaB
LLEQEQINIHDINDIVVVNGPGSFTGVRIGVTIAKTLAFTLNIPIRTVTSLELYLGCNSYNKTALALKEKNGYFFGQIDVNNQITNYQYLTKAEFEEYFDKKNMIEAEEMNLDEIVTIAHQKAPVNPHEVNPFYVKKIEVEK